MDIITLDIEKIATKLRRAEVNPAVVEVIVELHEQMRMLQGGVNELIQFYDKILPLLKLTQALHRENKAALQRIEKRYSDPNADIISSEPADDT